MMKVLYLVVFISFSRLIGGDVLISAQQPQLEASFHTNQRNNVLVPTNEVIRTGMGLNLSVNTKSPLVGNEINASGKTLETIVNTSSATQRPKRNSDHQKLISENRGSVDSLAVSSTAECPPITDSMSQTQLIEALTNECRYDRLQRPKAFNASNDRNPVDVHVRFYFYSIEILEISNLQFSIKALLQLRFNDERLAFEKYAPSRTKSIMGQSSLRQALWVPHIFLVNEASSNILGTENKEYLTSISPNGTVILSSRFQATLSCWMNLQKFPFDKQDCSTVLESWMYNTSDLVLHWEQDAPVTIAPNLHLTGYVLLNNWTSESIVDANITNLSHGALIGNYSSLTFTIYVAREAGFYLMNYFLPSMMIVAASWVTFWLQADQTAPRAMIGSSTMLSFITLTASQGQTLPKVSYIKVSEIWYLGCITFIFASLLEFAFVNTIWRRKKDVELKKVNSKYILKSTLTPRPHKKIMGTQKSKSCSNLNMTSDPMSNSTTSSYDSCLTVNSFNSQLTVPCTMTQSMDDVCGNGGITITVDPPSDTSIGTINKNDASATEANNNNSNNWTTMTPKEISIWIDRRSRLVFPCAFVVFNTFFWTFVYCL